MNYREHMRKGECLLNAIVWTALPILDLPLSFYDGSILDIPLFAMEAVACAIHWYRYLAYDRKQEES